jgi:hypothetical protein
MVNDINLEDPESNLLIKFADDLTVSAPVKTTGDSAASEVRNIKGWASDNRMTLNTPVCLKRGKLLFVAEQRSHYRSNWMVLSAKTG